MVEILTHIKQLREHSLDIYEQLFIIPLQP
jgi:hypothetical protein